MISSCLRRNGAILLAALFALLFSACEERVRLKLRVKTADAGVAREVNKPPDPEQ